MDINEKTATLAALETLADAWQARAEQAFGDMDPAEAMAVEKCVGELRVLITSLRDAPAATPVAA